MRDRPMLRDDEVEQRVSQEIDDDEQVRLDPFWYPQSVTVDELACILARSYMLRTGLMNMKADVKYIEDTNAGIAKRIRWLRNRGNAKPSEIPNVKRLRDRYCKAAAILAEEPEDYPTDPHETDVRDIADLAMGTCHMIAREFHGSSDVLFHDL